MQLADYIGKTDFDLIHFSITLAKEIDCKIKNKVFFYQNQVSNYINDKIDHFIHTLHVKSALEFIYKVEILKMLKPKLDLLFEKHRLLSCV
ncbi:hypothetical protein [Metabacillus endolithicus]|uniref:DUF86 domain-containing protein n=1 Tax=Metabacillus endolithicus TaxID=1535204 RepID=A0ABW5BX18_9BACI|nr:hypothetical protein [Metabacillus endolithicus]UPG64183.1 hypothetical protein MVE64_03370 [Metabacillus endolithicus]